MATYLTITNRVLNDLNEVELFENLFSDILHHISMTVKDEIFVPNQGMDVHEH